MGFSFHIIILIYKIVVYHLKMIKLHEILMTIMLWEMLLEYLIETKISLQYTYFSRFSEIV